jgi:hypothetical protein
MAGGQFEVGHPKLPGAGRKPGTPNKLTLLKRENAVSAIETFRNMGVSLPGLGVQR